MNKLIRWLGIVAGTLLVLILVAIVVLPMVIDPNDYKSEISAAVESNTGRTLTMEGDLELSVFPWLGIGIGQSALANAKGFSSRPFAQVAEVQIRVKLLPLLSRQLVMDTVVLKGLQVSLETDKSGKTNWQDLSADKAAKASSVEKQHGGGDTPVLAGLAIGGVEISGARIRVDDRHSGSRLQIDDFNLTTGAIGSGDRVPVALSMKVSGTDLPEGGLAPSLAFDLALDFGAQSLQLSAIKARLDDSTVEGSFSVANLSQPAIRFDLRLDTIDVDRYLSPKADAAASVVPATHATAAIAGASMIPVAMLRELDVAGKLSVGKLKAAQLRSRDVVIPLKVKNGVVRVYPATAAMYEGNYKGDIKLDVRGRTPLVSMNESLSGVQIGPLLKDLTGQGRLQGKAEVSAQLTAKGQTPDEFKRTLNGKLALSLADGAVKGINLIRIIRKGQALLKGKTLPQTDQPEQTDFSELTGSATVVNGVIKNTDLRAKSPLIRIDGKGKVSLPAETINYVVTTKLVGSLEGQSGKDLQDLRGIAIPVKISGTFSDPVIKPKLDSAVKDVAKKKIKKELKKKFGKKLEKQLDNKLKGLFR